MTFSPNSCGNDVRVNWIAITINPKVHDVRQSPDDCIGSTNELESGSEAEARIRFLGLGYEEIKIVLRLRQRLQADQ